MEMLISNLIYFLYMCNQSHNQGYAAYQDQDLGIGCVNSIVWLTEKM